VNLRRSSLLVSVVATSAVAAACTIQGGVVARATPTCDLHQSLNALILEAQSVPTAERVPCVATLPAGWLIHTANARSGRSEVVLGNDRAGMSALVVHLEPGCDTKGSTEIPTDDPGARRFERIESVTPGFAAVRYYMFPGGCITYRFNLSAKGRALVNEVSLAVDSTSRARLDDEIHRRSHGHVRL
jgi:hypothetical protein